MPPKNTQKAAAPKAKASLSSSLKAAAPVKAAAKSSVQKAAAPSSKAAAPSPKAAAPVPKAAAGSSVAANGVYVKNWGTGSVADAQAAFSAAGKVQKVQIRRHRYALIFFESAAGVKKAIDLFNEKEVLGQVVTVVPAKTSPKPDPHLNSSCVFVSPIFRSSTTKKQIMELFEGVGVLRQRTYRRNYMYAYMNSPVAAKKFVEAKNGSEFRGHKLRVALSAKSLDKLKAKQQHAMLLMAAHRHHKKEHK
ncbi:unnamed protein product [Phytomonas sp. Hart1]|nr:unnamed protein product [Phytomonas sp. Hart1]|eukprot:CCW70578.1 unnamed protein product [Phytomonas sp. isolate Hart1]